MAGVVEDAVGAGSPAWVAVVSPGTVVLLPADRTALSLLHQDLSLWTGEGGTELLLVTALDVTVLTPTHVTPLGAPHLAVTQGGRQVVQSGTWLCKEKW